MKGERIKYLDYAKGFAIILMVFGHVEVCNEAIHNWIYSFHMPIFFLICGMLMYQREMKGKVDCVGILKKRCSQLGIPYIVGSVLFSMFCIILRYFSGKPLELMEFVEPFFFLWGISVMWFIPCYIIAEFLLALIVRHSKLGIILPICFFLLSYYILQKQWIQSMHLLNIARMLLGCVIAFIGYLIAKFEVLKHFTIVMAIVGVVIGSYGAQVEGYTSMAELNVGNPLSYLVISLVLSLSFLKMFMCMEGFVCVIWKKVGAFLSYWGINSIVILITHEVIIEVMRLLDYKLTGLSIRDSGLIGSIPLTIAILMIEFPIIYLVNHQLSFLFGKRK